MNSQAQPEEANAHPSLAAFRSTLSELRRRTGRNVLAFKFGGSSLLGAERMMHAASLVRDAASRGNVVVVVSAMKGVTDSLLSIAAALDDGRAADASREADHLCYVHFDVLRELRLDPFRAERVARDLHLLGKDFFHDVSASARAAWSSREALHDLLASYGERFSARLFAAALEKSGIASVPVSSSEFVLTCDTFRHAQPHIEETRRRGREILLPLFTDRLVPVVTGFIGSTADGRVTTLGRNSSDFSGALVAHVVDADELVIWTDVDGIYTANPHESAEARLLHELSYDQAYALAASGAKVLHAKVLPLAAETEMVVWVRNTFNPRSRGTRIGPSPEVLPVAGHSEPHAGPPALSLDCHSGRSKSAAADEHNRGISPPQLNDSLVVAPRGCHNSNVRGEA
ncbi:MAG TPA: aspartate kinase [Candidatus Eisenbacteria bacterium]|nr:aspartate kinase [Candidatus Eisenbacteria bacterium]